MKTIVKFIVAAITTLPLLSGCLYQESMDTFVEWGFAKDTESNISNGLETILPSAQVIFNAFDTAFYSDYADVDMSHMALMKSQSGKSKAEKNARNTAAKAASMIESGHICPVDYIFVVRIQYGCEGDYKTVWSHDYRHE